jgi:hypothetical protein
MPFVPSECRDPNHTSCSVGDLCYIEYRKLMDAWNKEPRWTTAHNELKRMFRIEDDVDAAKFLAYMVWFNFHVIEYEKKKMEENGDIV